ncbi:hypothetical protein A2954_05090 [Candidatus Roizmanbacteria bacterium RIFCSPLOWO2_01_FULL_37_12]|uniref:DUF5678 domain-containing protein n=1 Tax=Candidatus Roizmanbacteria bacterium RIFCSPLOWO2_01_FULL_37_12 TaxID=1802056 RepID=A0A1F7I8T3_9BACT|nr:MAG: hypothetical protein A2768_02185 [Candidatus Roizmanbacteria bacterium RIFCSPHIGHO2_01_FULL_37_16]OGK23729.1 MAG: hypothetical protein A3D76_04135 [Candidatus Roizmanbacteria bacterium RIFCSPHIGHO2_02_FULL_37_9b]OGK39770.1 MAG: hypothetical protein A2954_05090 [Candidatus Roizmanbacteria bacterium RIFCSPLOWO2_01_FULL_37_12]
MKADFYIRLQKKFGGKWVATDKTGSKVFAYGKNFDEMYDMFEKKKVDPKKAVIGFIEKYGQTYIHFSLSI